MNSHHRVCRPGHRQQKEQGAEETNGAEDPVQSGTPERIPERNRYRDPGNASNRRAERQEHYQEVCR